MSRVVLAMTEQSAGQRHRQCVLSDGPHGKCTIGREQHPSAVSSVINRPN